MIALPHFDSNTGEFVIDFRGEDTGIPAVVMNRAECEALVGQLRELLAFDMVQRCRVVPQNPHMPTPCVGVMRLLSSL